jgi:cytochrome b5
MHFTTTFCHLTIQVYDVTPFMDEHPGGDEVLLAVTGEPYFGDFIILA